MIEHKFTPKTLGFDVLKETFGPEDLEGITVNGELIPTEKLANVYSNIRNSPRIPGTCFIFKDTLYSVLNEMSEADKLKRAHEIKELMLNPSNFSSQENMPKVIELEQELRKIGY